MSKEKKFNLQSEFKPAGDQPQAIDMLVKNIDQERNLVLKGITGSGKTFTMANTIANLNRPTLIMVHNKTLASQIYEEMKFFFPNNAIEYFVSYYDYYQPEAYLPRTDTYIEKDSSINEHIDLMRHSATRSLLERRDTIVVASVSCIYGLGSPVNYLEMTLGLKIGDKCQINQVTMRLSELQYERNDLEFSRGKFRVKGDTIDVIPSFTNSVGLRISFFGNEIEKIHEFDPLTGKKVRELNSLTLYPNNHFVTPKEIINEAVNKIEKDLSDRLDFFRKTDKLVEAQRLEQKTNLDIEMLKQTGTCKGIENYSRYLTGRNAGSPPPTLFEYLPKDALLFVDESHVSIPQIRGMYNGDRARKNNLVEFGFRLPSAFDNRPLKFEEWDEMRPNTIFVSATPGEYELSESKILIEQVIRPTGLLDPVCEIRPATNQVDDLLGQIQDRIVNNERILVTTLTKKMSEDLTNYLIDNGIKVTYLHSDVDTLERIKIIQDLRKKKIDVIVGINLLREGLDIPECSLVAILDADKEGFLRSETSLIQTIGRAARNANGRVILYADKLTKSIQNAIGETNRRRSIQIEFNQKNGITPKTILKTIKNDELEEDIIGFSEEYGMKLSISNLDKKITTIRNKMFKEAADLNFEKAAKLRDEIDKLNSLRLKLSDE